MKALSLIQPWASLMAIGEKCFETRSWPTRYRGPLLIHAAKQWTPRHRELIRTQPYHDDLRAFFDLTPAAPLPLGCVVAVADLVACETTDFIAGLIDRAQSRNDPQIRVKGRALWYAYSEFEYGDYHAGRFVWLFDNVRRLRRPIPLRGAQGLFSADLNPHLLEYAA